MTIGHSLGRVVVVYLLLAAPLVAAVLFWGSWGWMAGAVAVGIVQYLALRRSQRFSARLWRNAPLGRRRHRERAVETVYVVAAVAGVVLLVVAVLLAL
jgi:hypothetical protein